MKSSLEDSETELTGSFFFVCFGFGFGFCVN